MPTTSLIEVSKLKLDLKNLRTIPQKNEEEAIRAMISIKPDRFYGVMDSLISDGYLPTENIIVLQNGTENIVKEGNRRIASLKIIHGHYKFDDFSLPESTNNKIKKIDAKWKAENSHVPCTVFTMEETEKVDRIVSLAHGKGEKASKDPWSSVARARHNRDFKGIKESGLDLLEKYLVNGSNINNQQRERWGGEYNLTILDEALRKCFSRIGFTNVTELVDAYPKIKFLQELENIILEIGLEQIKFETIRNTQLDFPTSYGILPIVVPPINKPNNETQSNTNTNNTTNSANLTNTNTNQNQQQPAANNTTTNTPTSAAASATASPTVTPPPPKAVAVNDPKHVANLLKKFAPRGANRQKVVTLRDEIRKLKIADNPIAFCFILRSLFEISAIAYCSDHSINLKKSNGYNKTLVELLKEITLHLTNNDKNEAMIRVLHGAKTEISKPEGILSVTSLNQLVHNPAFSIIPSDICILFGNIYPLLEAMN